LMQALDHKSVLEPETSIAQLRAYCFILKLFLLKIFTVFKIQTFLTYYDRILLQPFALKHCSSLFLRALKQL
jgi:hypothetical protein